MSEFWRIGRLLRPWGAAGEWLVAPDAPPEKFLTLTRVFIKTPTGPQPLAVTRATVRGEKLMLAFAPSTLVRHDAELLLPESEIAPDPADPVPYVHDLVGAILRDPTGRTLGSIIALNDYPAGPMLVVQTPHGQRLVPYVEAYQPRFERETKSLHMDLPPGLIDAREAREIVDEDEG